MTLRTLVYSPLLIGLMAAPAFAQTNGATAPAANDPNAVQRDVNQQDRIENGLKSGNLSSSEAGRLENGENRIDRSEARDEKNGVTPGEAQQLQREQNAESRAIRRDDDNAVKGNPNSASSQRMQTDVQRDARQQTRIENGVDKGSLTTGETARLERGQAHDDKLQANATRNGGGVSAREQKRIQRSQNARSRHIHALKHNNRTANPAGTAPAAQ